MQDRPSCFGDGLSNEKVGSNFNESGEFVYVCGPELSDSGENVEGYFGVEPKFGEKCLEQGVDSGVRVEADCGFKVGATRVVNEG